MTDKQPEALEVAATLENTPANAAHWERGGLMERAAMTIRRLHAENAALLAANRDCVSNFEALMADYKSLTAAARQGLGALEQSRAPQRWPFAVKQDAVNAIAALRAALDAPTEQAEPVALTDDDWQAIADDIDLIIAGRIKAAVAKRLAEKQQCK